MSTVVRAVFRQAGRTLTTGIALGGLVVTSLALDGACERPIRRTVTANATQPVASTVANVVRKLAETGERALSLANLHCTE